MINRIVITIFLAMAVAACSGADSSRLFEGERTPIRVGLDELRLDFEVDRRSFFTVFSEGDEDLVCRIRDASGSVVAEDDDSGQDMNCAVTTLLEAGEYQVGISGYESSDRGNAYITANALDSQSIELEEVVSLSVSGQSGAVLAFNVERDGGYLITTSGQLDTVCALFNERGVEVASNDDYGDDYNCGINQRLSAGAYNVVVTSFDNDSGSATFMVSEADIKSYTLVPGTPQSARIGAASDRVEFDITVADSGRFELRTSGTMDTVCELRSATGELMGENDDGDDQNCQIRHALPTGDYRFMVSGYSGETGQFTAHFDRR